MDFLKLAKERYSCRKLTDKAIEPEKIDLFIKVFDQIIEYQLKNKTLSSNNINTIN